MMMVTMSKREMLNTLKTNIPIGLIASLDDGDVFIFDGSNWIQTAGVDYKRDKDLLKQQERRDKFDRLNID